MSTIFLITTIEKNPRTGMKEEIIDAGYDINTMEPIILPAVPPRECGAVWDHELGGYIIVDPPEKKKY